MSSVHLYCLGLSLTRDMQTYFTCIVSQEQIQRGSAKGVMQMLTVLYASGRSPVVLYCPQEVTGHNLGEGVHTRCLLLRQRSLVDNKPILESCILWPSITLHLSTSHLLEFALMGMHESFRVWLMIFNFTRFRTQLCKHLEHRGLLRWGATKASTTFRWRKRVQ